MYKARIVDILKDNSQKSVIGWAVEEDDFESVANDIEELVNKNDSISHVSKRQSKCWHLNVTNRICNKCKRVITYVPDGC